MNTNATSVNKYPHLFNSMSRFTSIYATVLPLCDACQLIRITAQPWFLDIFAGFGRKSHIAEINPCNERFGEVF